MIYSFLEMPQEAKNSHQITYMGVIPTTTRKKKGVELKAWDGLLQKNGMCGKIISRWIP